MLKCGGLPSSSELAMPAGVRRHGCAKNEVGIASSQANLALTAAFWWQYLGEMIAYLIVVRSARHLNVV